jgi:tetratricopeptide (TPR) repeat protein
MSSGFRLFLNQNTVGGIRSRTVLEEFAVKQRLLVGLLALGAPLWMGSAALAQKPPTTPSATAAKQPTDAKQYLALAKYYYLLTQYDSAYYAFRRVLDLEPRNTDALLGLGRTQNHLRLYPASIDTLKILMQTDPKNPSVYIALAQTYKDQYSASDDRDLVKSNLDEALKLLQSAEGLNPAPNATSLAAIYNERALLYSAKDDDKKALEAAQKAATILPENSDVLSNLGRLLYKTGDTKGALEVLKKASASNPKDALTKAFYGKLLVLSGDQKAGIAELSSALRQSPKNAYIIGQYGVARYLDPVESTRKANMDDSKKFLETAVKADPLRYPEFYYYLGRISLDRNDCKTGKSHLAKAVVLEPQLADYRYQYARALDVCGDRTSAKNQYQAALKLDPNLQEAKDALAKIDKPGT